MSEHLFGLGDGHLSERAEEIAAEHDATLVNYTDAPCNCGYGCRPHTCKNSRRHWFTTRNYGEPFNSATATAVLDALRAAGEIEPALLYAANRSPTGHAQALAVHRGYDGRWCWYGDQGQEIALQAGEALYRTDGEAITAAHKRWECSGPPRHRFARTPKPYTQT